MTITAQEAFDFLAAALVAGSLLGLLAVLTKVRG